MHERVSHETEAHHSGRAGDPHDRHRRAHSDRSHSLDKYSESSLPVAPPFRILHRRYPVESLEEALGEGIMTGHPSMPEFRLDPGQIADLIAFLKSLE